VREGVALDLTAYEGAELEHRVTEEIGLTTSD
jgi:hypothetical protein